MSQKPDQFASLFESSLKPKTAQTNSNLSLLERQKLQSTSSFSSQSGSSTPSTSQWNGLDLLGRSGSSSKNGSAAKIPNSNVSSSGSGSGSDLFEGFDTLNSEKVNGTVPMNASQGSSKTEDLFEGFKSYTQPPSSTPPLNQTRDNGSASGNVLDDFDIFANDTKLNSFQNKTTPQSQDIDDLFSVFDTPSQAPTPAPVPAPVIADRPPQPPQSRSPSSSNHDTMPSRPKPKPRAREPLPTVNQDTYDESIAQLMEMGFSLEQSKSALAQTTDGVNVEQAITVLMNAAHSNTRSSRPPLPERRTAGNPDYIQNISKLVSSTTTKLMKSKYINDVSSMFAANGSGSDDGRPAWMRDNAKYKDMSRGQYDDDEPVEFDEQMLQGIKLSQGRRDLQDFDDGDEEIYERPQPSKPRAHQTTQVRHQKFKFDDDGDAVLQSQSRHRRREPAPAPRPIVSTQSQPEIDLFSLDPIQEHQQQQQPEVDLFSSPAVTQSKPEIDLFNTHIDDLNGTSTTAARNSSSSRGSSRPTVPITSTQLSFFKDSREQGSIAYKQGDFTLALQHYEVSLESLPLKHILRIIAYSNCITTLLKNGQNKKALAYSDAALEIIGEGKGKGEEVEPTKDMFSFWVKISTKRAEALEHLEKYQEALQAYTTLIENGSTGKIIMEGKRRCQDVLNPKPKPTSKPKTTTTTPNSTSTQRKPHPAPRPASSSSFSSAQQFTNETVERVKATHHAEEALESQKFALHDMITAKLQTWSSGNETNLRVLLSTLHTILPSEQQWKPVSATDLVMPKKVKINYMKAVSKCHPDKIKKDATVENRMICEGVFVVLNTAWEGFKAENGL
ncbi:hypothetical protein WICPIJ_007577 [Wickerhamomyces pijperi]|uniref:UBA domain-containing protein n=1 Tax=Wickerhamomyces pijperi TaxID=599730 RepID=A0A9P8TJ56_WICPI|nr:hypothetical protein WICPIJ_007577 [Wickerhamomyces pijperi]